MRTTMPFLTGSRAVARRDGVTGRGRSERHGGEAGSSTATSRELPVRARLLRPAVALALTSSGVLGLSASAAPAGPVTFQGVVGDANLLNTQNASIPAAGPGTATPGSQAGLDIVEVEMRSTFGPPAKGATARTCTGFQLVMTLSGPPAANAFFDMSATSARNNRLFVISYESRTRETRIRYGGDSGYGTRHLEPAEVRGSTITWTVTRKDIQQIREKAGSVLSLRRASTSLSPDGYYLGVFDKAPAGEEAFTLCT